jgi:Methyltransferase domain
VSTDESYLLDNQQTEAGERFDALARLLDPVTFRHLDQTGVTTGWRCWEVGAGGVSVPAWLTARVGPAGRVLATDIDTSWLPADLAGVEVRRHDIGSDPAPDGPFDLVHARLVLVHVPARAAGLATDAEIDEHLTNVATGRMDLATSPLISARACKPTP